MCSNNVSISCHFFDTTTFRVYVTACRAPSLEKSVSFGKQLRLKTIDTFPSMYTHSVVNTCHIHWWIGVRKVWKQLKWRSRSLKVIDIGAIRCDFLLVFHCNYVSILYRFWDISTYFQNVKRSCDPKCTPILQNFNMCNASALCIHSANQIWNV